MSIRIFRHYIQLPFFLLIVLEASIAFLAIRHVAGLRSPLTMLPLAHPVTVDVLFVFAALFALAQASMGLYHARLRVGPLGLLLRMLLASGATFIILWIFTLLLPHFNMSAMRFGLALLITIACSSLVRLAFLRLLPEEVFKRRVLVYGAGRQAMSISALRRRADQIGFMIVGYVPSAGDTSVASGAPMVAAGELLEYCKAHDVDEIVVAMDDRRRAFPLHDLLQCRLHGVSIVELLSFLERETGKVHLDVMHPSWMIFSGGFLRSPGREAVARLVDVVASVLLLSVTWPVLLLTAVAIKIEDGWRAPVLYRQIRVGRDGRPFSLYKFRSMTVDAESDGVARWAVREDPRVSRVGGLIRLLRVDELPQLFNVLRGEMRFIGPRPERPEFVGELSERIPYYQERHVVKPGLTGWAQLCYPYGASETDAVEKLQLDLYYIKNRTFLFDLAILAQTVEVVLFGKGAR